MKRVCLLLTISCICTALVCPALSSASQFQVGVSPGVLNIGEIYPGDSRRASFIITTTSDQGFMVDIDIGMGSLDFFDGRHSDLLGEYSEQDASSWVKFLNVPIYLDTESENSGANVIKAEKINFIVQVPESAEPGYHLVEIIPKPQVPGGGSASVSIVAITKINLLLKVVGEAERSGEVLDMTARIVGKRTMVDVLFKNTGSVSMYAKANSMKLFDTGGKLLENIRSTRTFTEPGQVVKLSGFVTKALDPGAYLASTNVTYGTGHAAKETDVWIEHPSQLAVPAPTKPSQAEFPWWIVILAILIIAYIIYRYV